MSEILKVRNISFEFWNAIVFFDDMVQGFSIVYVKLSPFGNKGSDKCTTWGAA